MRRESGNSAGCSPTSMCPGWGSGAGAAADRTPSIRCSASPMSTTWGLPWSPNPSRTSTTHGSRRSTWKPWKPTRTATASPRPSTTRKGWRATCSSFTEPGKPTRTWRSSRDWWTGSWNSGRPSTTSPTPTATTDCRKGRDGTPCSHAHGAISAGAPAGRGKVGAVSRGGQKLSHRLAKRLAGCPRQRRAGGSRRSAPEEGLAGTRV